MKKHRFYFLLVACLVAIIVNPLSAKAQNNKDSVQTAKVEAMVAKQRYVFKAQSVTPQSGRFRHLTTEYDMQVLTDTIIAYLPYFGRAYSAPIGSSSNGIEFTSKDFDYTSTERKKGGWDVIIKFKDVQTVQQMQLTIFDNGTSSLHVTSRNREAISFNGYITEPAKKKSK